MYALNGKLPRLIEHKSRIAVLRDKEDDKIEGTALTEDAACCIWHGGLKPYFRLSHHSETFTIAYIKIPVPKKTAIRIAKNPSPTFSACSWSAASDDETTKKGIGIVIA
jgi:hypothetical protein